LTGVNIASIGTVTNHDDWIPLELVVEADAGGFVPFPNIPELAAYLHKWHPGNAQRGGYIDILFTKDQFNWGLDQDSRVRVTIGVDAGQVPVDQVRSNWFPPRQPNNTYQGDTRLCFDFDPTPNCDEFLGDFYHVGLVSYDLNVYDVGCPVGNIDPDNPTFFRFYPANFQPANPAIAQIGVLTQECSIDADWPEKGDPCIPRDDDFPLCSHGPYKDVDNCPDYNPEYQINDPPCANYPFHNYDVPGYFQMNTGFDPCNPDWNDCNIFYVTEECIAGSQKNWVFECEGSIDVTLNSNCLGTLFADDGSHRAWAYLYGTGSRQLAVDVIDAGHTLRVYFDDTYGTCEDFFYLSRDYPICVAIAIGTIYKADICCLTVLPGDEFVEVTVDINYNEPDQFCQASTIPPIEDFKIAEVYGCVPVPQEYVYALWYPYLPPINAEGQDWDWWGGIAVTNYADTPVLGLQMFFYSELGSEFVLDINADPNTPNALEPHEMWLAWLTSINPTPTGPDLTFGDETMSAILYVTVMVPPQTLETGVHPIDRMGVGYGVDSFVLMGDNIQAYGYKARVQDSNFMFPVAPIWNK
jgi:hypothetical protein